MAYNKEGTKDSLKYFRSKHDVGGDLEEMELERTQKVTRENYAYSVKRPEVFGNRYFVELSEFRYFLNDSFTRRLIFLGSSLMIIQQLSLLNLTSNFFDTVLLKTDINKTVYRWFVIGTYLICFISTLSFVPLADFVGRKKVIVASITILLIVSSANIILIASECESVKCSYAVLLFKNLYAISYSVGIGPITWVCLPEMFQQIDRCKGVALCLIVFWTMHLFGNLLLRSLEFFGNILFSVVSVMILIISVTYVNSNMKESRGKTFLELFFVSDGYGKNKKKNSYSAA